MSRPSRREFAQVAGAVLGAALVPRRAGGDEAKPAAPVPTPTPTPAKKLAPAAEAEAQARVQMIVARWGARLSPAERADLVRLSRNAQAMLTELRAFPLE